MLLSYYILIFFSYAFFWAYFIRRDEIESYKYTQFISKFLLLLPFWGIFLFNVLTTTVPALIKWDKPTDFTQKIIIENNTKNLEYFAVYSRIANTYDWEPVSEYIPRYRLELPEDFSNLQTYLPNYSFVQVFPPKTADTLIFSADTAKYDRIYIENTAGFKFASDTTSYAIAFKMLSAPIKIFSDQLIKREVPALKPDIMPTITWLIFYITALNGLIYHLFKHRNIDLINRWWKKIIFYFLAFVFFIVIAYMLYNYGMDAYYLIMRYGIIDKILEFDFLDLINYINFNKLW